MIVKMLQPKNKHSFHKTAGVDDDKRPDKLINLDKFHNEAETDFLASICSKKVDTANTAALIALIADLIPFPLSSGSKQGDSQY